MALSTSITFRTVTGNERLVIADVTFDNSYTTGGLAVTPAMFGLQAIHSVVCLPHSSASRIVTFDKAASKLKVHTAIGTEAAAASDQSTITVTCLVVGV